MSTRTPYLISSVHLTFLYNDDAEMDGRLAS